MIQKENLGAKAWPGDRPLFREQRLKGSDKPVLIVEGEKSVMAGEENIFFQIIILFVGAVDQTRSTLQTINT